MNYFKLHIGDYIKSTAHLTLAEQGIYLLLLCKYYDTEQPMTYHEARRCSKCKTEEERALLDAVLADFFTLNESGEYIQSRVEREIAASAKQAKTSQENGKLGGRPRKEKKPTTNQQTTEEKPIGLKEVTQNNLNPLIHQSTNPETSKAIEPQAARFDEFWSLYPSKKGKVPAKKTWKSKKLDRIADQIIVDVKERIAFDKQWLDGFIPHGSTYVSKEVWNDEITKVDSKTGKAMPVVNKELESLIAEIAAVEDKVHTVEHYYRNGWINEDKRRAELNKISPVLKELQKKRKEMIGERDNE